MYLYFWKSPVVSTGPDSGLAVGKWLDEARASERWKIREAGVSSSCSGEESGVRPTGLFTPSGFQDRRLRPLGHLFVFALMHGQLSGAFNCGAVSTENEFVKVVASWLYAIPITLIL